MFHTPAHHATQPAAQIINAAVSGKALAVARGLRRLELARGQLVRKLKLADQHEIVVDVVLTVADLVDKYEGLKVLSGGDGFERSSRNGHSTVRAEGTPYFFNVVHRPGYRQGHADMVDEIGNCDH